MLLRTEKEIRNEIKKLEHEFTLLPQSEYNHMNSNSFTCGVERMGAWLDALLWVLNEEE